MQLTGHRTRSVFDRYDIVSEADLTQAVEKLSRSQREAPSASHQATARVGTRVSWRALQDLNPQPSDP
jgi:hypothetical protein